MSTALSNYHQDEAGISLWRKPEQVLAEAKEAATALISVISQKKDKVIFNGEQYIEREDWGMVAKFYGCSAKSISTNYVNFDGIRGFEATAVCLDRNLNEIGRAESMCLSDEDNWGDVPVYEWRDELDANGKKIWVAPANGKKGHYKGRKIQIGTKPKPLFQLRSMAQTRAEAKVLKATFGFVVVLAGYKPTPAEEMTGYAAEQRQDPQEEPETTQQGDPRITVEQVNELTAILKTSDYTTKEHRQEVRAYLKANFGGIETTPELKVSQLPAFTDWAKKPRLKPEVKEEPKKTPFDEPFAVLDWKPEERAEYLAKMSRFSELQILADLNRLVDEMTSKEQ